MAPNEALSLTQFPDRLRQAALQDVQCEEPGNAAVPPDEEEGGLWES